MFQPNFGFNDALKAMDGLNIDGIFSDFDENDRMIMSTLVQKLKDDKNYNPLPELPEKANKIVHSLADQDKKGNDTLKLVEVARDLINEYKELEELNTEKNEIKDFIVESEEKMHDIITNQKSVMEERMIKAAEKETDPEKKKKLLDIVGAFKDGYNFDKLLEVVKTDLFKKYYSKKKYYNRATGDFDFLIQHSMKNNVNIYMVRNALKLCKLFQISDKEIQDVCLALGVAANGVIPEDKPKCWFLFTMANNIITLCYSPDKSEDVQKRRENFIRFVNEMNDIIDTF